MLVENPQGLAERGGWGLIIAVGGLGAGLNYGKLFGFLMSGGPHSSQTGGRSECGPAEIMGGSWQASNTAHHPFTPAAPARGRRRQRRPAKPAEETALSVSNQWVCLAAFRGGPLHLISSDCAHTQRLPRGSLDAGRPEPALHLIDASSALARSDKLIRQHYILGPDSSEC